MVNVLAIIVGTALGLVLKRCLKKEVQHVIMQGMGIAVLSIGIMDMLSAKDSITMVLVLILSLSIGGMIGALLKIQDRLEWLGQWLQEKLSKDENSTLGEAFTSSVLIFCIGAMFVYGSINAGLGDPSTLFVKSILDGTMSMILSSSLGWGVALSSVPVFLGQGAIAMCAGLLQPLLVACPDVKTMLSAIGGVLVMCIGINILEIKKIRTADLLPAILGCFVMIWLGA